MAARFSRAELATFQGATVDDLMPPADRPLRLLFVGINPGLWTAATNAHFARKGNYFTDGQILESKRVMGTGKAARQRRIVYRWSFKAAET